MFRHRPFPNIVYRTLRDYQQWGLESADLLQQVVMWSISPYFTAVLLMTAGLYQFTPLKLNCLQHCRSPAQYLAEHFRPGPRGALRLGWKHGFYCLGCCWLLMALLFAGGIMNLIWIAGLSINVLIEKIAPQGQRSLAPQALPWFSLVYWWQWGGTLVDRRHRTMAASLGPSCRHDLCWDWDARGASSPPRFTLRHLVGGLAYSASSAARASMIGHDD